MIHRRTLVGRIAARISRIKRVSLHKKYGAPVFIAAVFLLSRTTTLETFSRGSVMFIYIGGVLDQEKDASLFLDETGLPAAQLRDSSRLKNIDTSFR